MKNTAMNKYHIFIIFILLAALFIFPARYLKNKSDSAAHEIKKKASANPIVSLSLCMSKELRQVAASYLWLRVDEYFHSTAVKFRKNTEIVPLFKLVTVFDSSFIDAYLLLAHHLAFHLEKPGLALAVLKEGIENNLTPPASKLSELYFESGWIHAIINNETNEAILALEAGQKYLDADCDKDNAHLAMRLMQFLKNSIRTDFDINFYRANLTRANMQKKIEESEAAHHNECEHNHEHDVNDHEHEYAGHNPWHNPFLCSRLKSGVYLYMSLLVIFFSAALLSAYRRA
jgi:hypothetical protein